MFSPRLSNYFFLAIIRISTLVFLVSTCLSPLGGNTGSGFALTSLLQRYMFSTATLKCSMTML
ncbi:unnamed protein product [Brassica oleracea]